jgi:hypothetical protein
MIQIPLTKPQLEFVTSDDPRPAIVGGLGSGKSRAGTMRLIYKMAESPGCSGAYYMPTYDLLRLRAMPGIEDDLISLGIGYTINKSEYKITAHGLGDIIFRSYDNPTRIIAYEVAHSICDELDTLPMEKAQEVWRKINERNREKISGLNTIGLVTTPDQGLSGFVYQKWVSKRVKGYSLIKAPTWSNPYLPDDYIEQIMANYDEKLAEMYISGEFVSLSQNKVYHYFHRARHHSDRELEKTDKVIHVSIDFNVGGCCSTVNVIDSNMPIAVEEFVTHDTDDFVNHLEENYKGRVIVVYPDASGKARSTNASNSDIQIIKKAGYQVSVNKANPRVRDRINSVNRLLSHNNVKINTNKCQQLTNALESQGYNKQGDPEKFDIHPAIDDWNDNFGYFIAKMYPINKVQIEHLEIQGF